MAPTLSEDEIDDLLYFARTGDKEEFDALKNELFKREHIGITELLEATKDEHSGNGVLHMAAANGHESTSMPGGIFTSRCVSPVNGPDYRNPP